LSCDAQRTRPTFANPATDRGIAIEKASGAEETATRSSTGCELVSALGASVVLMGPGIMATIGSVSEKESRSSESP
jgi:hypothetical protein